MFQINKLLCTMSSLFFLFAVVSCKDHNIQNNSVLKKITVKSVHASSHLQESNIRHRPLNTLDNNKDTCWVEGISGPGIFQWIKFKFHKTTDIKEFRIRNGFQKIHPKIGNLYYKNNRLKYILLLANNGKRRELTLKDKEGTQSFLINIKNVNYITLVIHDIYKGNKWDDTCLSDVEFWGDAVNKYKTIKHNHNKSRRPKSKTDLSVIVSRGGQRTKNLFERFKKLSFKFENVFYDWSPSSEYFWYPGGACYSSEEKIFKKHFTRNAVHIYRKLTNRNYKCHGKDCGKDFSVPHFTKDGIKSEPEDARCGNSYSESTNIIKYTITRKILEQMKVDKIIEGIGNEKFVSQKTRTYNR